MTFITCTCVSSFFFFFFFFIKGFQLTLKSRQKKDFVSRLVQNYNRKQLPDYRLNHKCVNYNLGQGGISFTTICLYLIVHFFPLKITQIFYFWNFIQKKTNKKKKKKKKKKSEDGSWSNFEPIKYLRSPFGNKNKIWILPFTYYYMPLFCLLFLQSFVYLCFYSSHYNHVCVFFCQILFFCIFFLFVNIS